MPAQEWWDPVEKEKFRRFCRERGIRGRQKKKLRRFIRTRVAESSAKDALPKEILDIMSMVRNPNA